MQPISLAGSSIVIVKVDSYSLPKPVGSEMPLNNITYEKSQFRSIRSKMSSWIQGQSYVWEFLPILFLAIRERSRTLEDLKVFSFVLLAPLYFMVGFKGKLNSPFGKAVVSRRKDTKSVAYGAFKTHFCYVKDLKRLNYNGNSLNVVVDIGANVGDFALTMAPRSGKVIAVEPASDNFELLQLNISSNKVTNVIPINVAAHDGNATLFLLGAGSATRVGGLEGGQRARGVPLDSVFQSLKLETVDILKIDVQGHEEKALLGLHQTLSAHRVRLIILELHVGWGVRVDKIESLMKSYGYSLEMRNSYLFGQPHLYFRANDMKRKGPVLS